MKNRIFSICCILSLIIIQTVEARQINVYHIGFSADALLYIPWEVDAPPVEGDFSFYKPVEFTYRNNDYHFKYDYPGKSDFEWRINLAPEEYDYYIIGLSSEVCNNLESLKDNVELAIEELEFKGDAYSKIIITKYPVEYAHPRLDHRGRATVDPSCDSFKPGIEYTEQAKLYNKWIQRFSAISSKIIIIDPWKNLSVVDEVDKVKNHHTPQAIIQTNLQIHPDKKSLQSATANYFLFLDKLDSIYFFKD
ncbi:MAG: hypothetical protein KAH20_06470 [Methylococcales bacterium]|nr:hypothetical protein [Methylococcales bacterium]